jgi:hypothetical protein
VPAGASRVTARFPAGSSVGLSLQVQGALPSQRVAITVAGHAYELGGSLSSALVPGPWQVAGFSQGYAVFTLRRPPTPITATTASGRQLPVHVLSSTTKSEEISVDAPGPTTMVRSVAFDSGWMATVSVNGGSGQRVAVHSFDLVQQVHVPAGHDTVTFHYRPPHLTVASILSVGAVAFLLVLLVVSLVRRARRETDADEDGGEEQQLSETSELDEPERVG